MRGRSGGTSFQPYGIKQKRGLEWRDAAEDLLGHVHHARHSGRYGFAALVGAWGHDSDWHCELVVRVSDGLVWIGRTARPQKDAGLKPGATKATSQTTSKADSMSDMYAIGNLVKIGRTGAGCVLYCVCA